MSILDLATTTLASRPFDLDAEIAATERRLLELKRLRKSIRAALWMTRLNRLGLTRRGPRPRLPTLDDAQYRIYVKLRANGIARADALAEAVR